MTNKIEISRELADRLTRAYPAEITDQATIYTIRIEALAALDELRALLAAPAVERQEPVGFRYRAHGGHWEWMDESPFADGREHYKLGGEELQPLYTSPPTPSVERQPVAYVLARQTAVEVPGQERKELGYTLLDSIGVFHSREEVHAAIAELGLPLGWVSMTVEQLLPGWMTPANTSPPAPLAVVLPTILSAEQGQHYSDNRASELGYLAGYNACLDKIKGMNP